MFRFGADYYPEHWPEERWETDACLMQEAGINVVRLAEFAWAKMEPAPDQYDFAWLDRTLAVLAAHGISAILSTPTGSPAPWVMALYPDAYIVDESGVRRAYGNRREYCPTHPGYRERSRKVTHALAEHYHHHPAVIGWQTDNEFGDRCTCPICQRNFQEWLRKKYSTLDAVNAAWGAIFWSHTYSEWSQIPTFAATGGVPNPGLALDYDRFMSDAYVAFQQEQVDILRQVCPAHFVTHNFMGMYDKINYFDLAKPLDFVSWDNYPRGRLENEVDYPFLALCHDTMRGLKGKNFWMMEEQSGSGGWQTVAMNPRPGEIRLWSYQAIAHGADAILYFRWRAARFGTEQYWHGILDHDARPRRRYREVQQIGLELQRAGSAILESQRRARVAMVLSYDSRFAFQIQPTYPMAPDQRYSNYLDIFNGYYAALHRLNIDVDIISPDADVSPYAVVIAPALTVLAENTAAALTQFVQNGGVLLVTPRSGARDESNTIVNQPLPGLLAEVCGVEVDEYESLPLTSAIPLQFAGRERDRRANGLKCSCRPQPHPWPAIPLSITPGNRR